MATNKVISQTGAYFYNPTPGLNTNMQLEACLPVVVALGLNYQAQQKRSDLAKLKGITELIQAEKQVSREIREQLPELCR